MIASRPATTLLHRVGGTRRWVVVSVLFGSLTVAAGIGLVALSTHLITMSALAGTAATTSMVILGVRATAIGRVVSRYLDRYLGHLGTFRVLTRLRVWSYGALLDAEPLGDAQHPRGEIVTALVDDVETMQDHMLRVSVPPIVALVSLAVALAALAAIGTDLAVLVALASLAVAVPATLAIRRSARTAGRSVTHLRAERMARCTETIDALDELTAWGRSDLLLDALDAVERRERPAERRLARVRARTDSFVVLGTGSIVIATAALALRTPITDAVWVVAAPVIVLALSEVLAPLLSGAERSASTDAAAERIATIVDDHRPRPRPALVPSPTVGAAPDLEFDHVSFAFDATTVVLRDETVRIPWGSTVVVLAPSGTGKSTLASLLLGLRTPDAGAVRIDGVDVRAIDHEGERTVIAAVLQDDHLFDTTLRDDLAVADAAADDERIIDALTIVGLDRLVAERSLDLAVGEDGAALSGGERQRVLVARAMLADAPILVLDEAGEHLDRDRRRRMIGAVLDARRGRTTIVLAHDEDAITAADLVLELHDGRLRPRRP